MYCILVAGMPATGKSTVAKAVAERFKLPVISKDSIKEQLFDHVGFQSREEKVNLGIASMKIMYYVAEQLMKAGQPFILENNFEASENGIKLLLEKYQYPALTLSLTGDYPVIYRRFLERDKSPERHRGHVVNDCYPEKGKTAPEKAKAPVLSFEQYVQRMRKRGFDDFRVDGGLIRIDTTDFAQIDLEEIFSGIEAWKTQVEVSILFPPT
ncbi:MAG: ATP-binding protein [Lachnospiraceae bacterium]|nr:ATP-binding protein [Butyrivibrio sp.]MCM1411754.1 ATP-binding protein [Lachnospiraceae bacterium]